MASGALTDGRLNETMRERGSPAPNEPREYSNLKLRMKERHKDQIERKVKSHLDNIRYP